MNPTITTRPAFRVLGVQTRIDPRTADYPGIWSKRFDPHHEFVRRHATEQGHYGVYFPSGEPGKVDFIAGMAVAEVGEIPDDLVVREVPEAQYAVFECGMDAIGPTWQQIYGVWLPNSDRFAEDETKACLEHFPPGADEGKAQVSIHIPVRKRAG